EDAASATRLATIGIVDVNQYSKVNLAPAKKDGTIPKGEADLKLLRFVVARTQTRQGGGPIPVRLIARNANHEAIDPTDLKGNNLAGLLQAFEDGDGAKAVFLSLNTNGLPADGYAEVTVDGVGTFYRKFNGGEMAAPFGVSAPRYAIPGKPIAVRVMAPADAANLAVVFRRIKDTEGEQIKRLPSPRDKGIDVRIGSTGEPIFTTHSRDWIVAFPTEGIHGEHEFHVRSGAGKSGEILVNFDASKPTVNIDVQPFKPAGTPPDNKKIEYFHPGQRIVVTVSAADPESRIDPKKPVLIYIGEKPGPDGKPAPNGQVKEGKPVPGSPNLFSAAFDLPTPLTVSELKVGAIVVNNVGLASDTDTKTVIKIDYTPPVVSLLSVLPYDEKPPLQRPLMLGFKAGERVILTASAFDGESGIDSSRPPIFFIGDPPGPDGKPVQTTYKMQVAGNIVAGTAEGKSPTGEAMPTWGAEFVLPMPDKSGELKVGVVFFNNAGLPGVRVATVRFDITTGALKVKVLQADRPQPALKVTLLNAAGTRVAEGVTNDCGVFTFEKLPPGSYSVWAVKPADENSYGVKTVNVSPGETAETEVSVIRQPPPPAPAPAQPASRR
ncbi:MAG TPA: hypothetical protein VGL71_01630, partial [Urbifossiella sp.]